MMKSVDLTVGDALYLYTICSILPGSSDILPYKESLFLWLCIEPPRHAWRCPAIQHQVGKIELILDSQEPSLYPVGSDRATFLRITCCERVQKQ
jgi:hypothetical protein